MVDIVKSTVRKYIKGTPKKDYVKELTVLVCNLTDIVKGNLKIQTSRVYITTKVLKHMYDKRTAEEFDFVVSNLTDFIKFPERIYKNKQGKTGNYCFYKTIAKDAYFCVLEISGDKDPCDEEIGMVYVVSAYRLSEDKKKRRNYLSSYKLLWSWKGDNPSS